MGLNRNHRIDVWVPLVQVTAYRPTWILDNRNYSWLQVGGRVMPGVQSEAVQAHLAVLAARNREEYPLIARDCAYSAAPLATMTIAYNERARTALLLGGTVAALFVLACTNFFSLTLVRLLARRREIAVRMALGATHGAIGRWLLGEMTIVLGIGLATGAGLSFGLMRVLRFNPAVANLFDGSGVHLDLRAGGIVLLSAVLAITAVWLLLFRYLRRHDYVGAIKEGATAPSRLRAFSLLLATQLGVALLLIAMSASFLRTLWMTIVRDLPFRTDHVQLADIDLKSFSWYNDRARGHDFCRTVIDQLRSLPGVTAVGASTTRPLDRAGTTSIILDASSQQEDRRNRSRYTFIGPDFFGALGVRFLQGRDLAETELQQNQPVSVINRSMGSRFWPDEASPVGQTFRPWSGGPVTTVIGVVNDFPGVAPEDPQPQFFLPYTSDTIGRITLAIGVQDDSAAMHKQLAETLAAVWPNSHTPEPYPIARQVRESRSDLVASSRVMLWVAILAGVITAIGIYSFSAFTAAQTVRDSAIRMALGARPANIFRVHVIRYRWGVLAGLATGVALSLASGPLLQRLDITLQPLAPATIAAAGSLLVILALIGLCLPLRGLRRLDIRAILMGE